MTYTLSPGWRHRGIVSCPESFFAASSGISAGYRVGILACRPRLRLFASDRKSSSFASEYRYTQSCVQYALPAVCDFVRPQSDGVQNGTTMLPMYTAAFRQCGKYSRLFYLRNLDMIFPFMQRNAKAEGEPKSLWQASSAPRCLAFAWPEAREAKTSQILPSLGNAAVDGMHRHHACTRCVAERAGSF